MNLLYISKADGADYQCDMAFHGLRSLFGPSVVDANRMAHMYQGADTRSLYGKGFTLYGLLEEGEVDRTDISAKIRNNAFDYVIYGSIHRSELYFPEVMESYPAKKIIFIDGEDQPLFLKDCTRHGWYFKRELYSPQAGCFPIQFAIPEQKISHEFTKTVFMAPLDPMDTRTYVYDDEKSYYESYAASLFAKTRKKAGWDCLRHYEIMANGCLPYFENLEFCPDTIMTGLPKEELLLAKSVLEYKGFNFFETSCGLDLWRRLMERVQGTLRAKLTTTALAKYILDTVKQ